MTILKHLALALLIPTIAVAMEPIVDKTSPSTTELYTRALPSFLIPPQITYHDYVMAICVGNEIEGWGNASGGFGSWLQSSKNAQLLKDKNTNEIILDLQFFIITPTPVMLEPQIKSPSAMPQLRIDYSIPIPNSDESKGKPTFSLCRMMTEDDCVFVKLLLETKKEPEEAFLARQKQWLDEYERLTHRKIDVKGKLSFESSRSYTQLTVSPQNRSSQKIKVEGILSFESSISYTQGSMSPQNRSSSFHPPLRSSRGSTWLNYYDYDSYSDPVLDLSYYDNILAFSEFIHVSDQNSASASSPIRNNTNNSSRQTETPREHALRDPAGFAFSRFKYGTDLRLGFLTLGDDGIAAIAPHLNHVASQVKQFDLMKNNMTAQGIRALVPFLSQFINLKQLLLNGNPIGDEGLGILGPYLPHLPELETLFLDENNNVTDSGIIALIPHLTARICIANVGCFLGNEGKRKLREAGFGAIGMDWHRSAPVVRHDYGHPMLSTHFLF